MALTNNMWLQGQRKTIAGTVYYQAMGQTRHRSLAAHVTNPRTKAQMTQRIRWANLVSFYRVNSDWMKYAFETKKQSQSEYNKFMSLNVSTSPIALTKDAAASGACVVAPYTITQGSLPSIEWKDAGTQLKSNLYLPAGQTINEDTTVGEFSSGLLESNPAIREGDQLSLVRFSQMVNNSTGYPYVIVRKYEVLINSNSTAKLGDFIPTDYLQAPGLASQNAIYVNKESRQGGFVVILSRTMGGKTYVSTQDILIVNNEAMITQYSNSAAVAAAIASYGESQDAFLSTVSAATLQSQPIGNSLNLLRIGSNTYGDGSKTPTGFDAKDLTWVAVFAQAVESTAVVTCKIGFLGMDGTITDNQPRITGNNVQFDPSSGFTTEMYDKHIAFVEVTIDGLLYRIDFASSNAYTQEGLE